MKIKIWGCRGSLPTPGMKTVRYGGNTTCVEVRLADGTIIIFDAGSGIRKLGKELVKEQDISEIYLYLTHPHWDHLMGFPFFAPAYMERFKIHVRGGPRAKRSLRGYLAHQMEAPFFPVRFQSMKAGFDFTQGDPKIRKIGNAEIVPIVLSHPNGCYGFKIVEEQKIFVFFTDHELDFNHERSFNYDEYLDFCKGADLLIHDAQYTDEEYAFSKGWGHSTFNSATDFSIKAGVKKFGIFHHDPEHDDELMDLYTGHCKKRVEDTGSDFDCFAVMEGMDILI
ncbi:MBL fold metallo-hydrolase [Thermodesulfobacteriota bacterium]